MGNSFSGNTATNTSITNFIIPDDCTVEDLIILQNDYKLSDNYNTKKSSEVPNTTELPNISEVPIIPVVPKIKVEFFARVNNRDEHRTELDKILIWATSDAKVLKQDTNRCKKQSAIMQRNKKQML